MCDTSPTSAYRHEVIRKTIHVASALCPLIYAFIDRELMLWLATPLALAFIAADILRQVHPRLRGFYDRRFGQLMRRDENQRLCGASHVMIAVVLCVWLFPKPVAIAAMLFMSVSDALASLVGQWVGGPRWLNASLSGSAAFLLSALLIAVPLLWGYPLAAVCGALTATVVEALPLRLGNARIDDNISVPLSGGLGMWLLYTP
jgi:dolichol kinase